MSRIIRLDDGNNRGGSLTTDVAIPPGAWTCRFYQMGALVANLSGVDCHPTGARLIRVVGLLGTTSATDVVFALQKNDVEFSEFTIPAGGSLNTSVVSVLGGVSMDFAAVTDKLRVRVVTPGGSDLTVLAIFDR